MPGGRRVGLEERNGGEKRQRHRCFIASPQVSAQLQALLGGGAGRGYIWPSAGPKTGLVKERGFSGLRSMLAGQLDRAGEGRLRDSQAACGRGDESRSLKRPQQRVPVPRGPGRGDGLVDPPARRGEVALYLGELPGEVKG